MKAFVDLRAETDALVRQVQDELHNVGLPSWNLDDRLQAIVVAADGQTTLDTVFAAVRQALGELDLATAALRRLLDRLTALESRKLRYAPIWWEKRRAAI